MRRRRRVWATAAWRRQNSERGWRMIVVCTCRAELSVADSSRQDCVDVLRQGTPCCGIRLSASGWRSIANIETGRLNSGTVCCGQTKAPYSFSVGQSRRMYAGEKYSPQCIVPKVKHGGGSLMIWGCMSGLGVGQVYRCEGTMRQDQYIRVLRNHMLPSATALYGQGQAFVFQQDNAPCHKAWVCAFFERSGVDVLDWPAQSPDLNPIEHLWEVLFRKVQGRKPSNLDALWQLLREAWVAIPADTMTHPRLGTLDASPMCRRYCGERPPY